MKKWNPLLGLLLSLYNKGKINSNFHSNLTPVNVGVFNVQVAWKLHAEEQRWQVNNPKDVRRDYTLGSKHWPSSRAATKIIK